MLILFELILHSYLIKSCILLHFINDFIVYRHRMEAYYETDYLRFNTLYLFEKFQLTNLWDGYSFLWICYQHSLDDFNRIYTNITRQNIETFNHFFVKLFCRFLLKRKRATNHPIKNNPQRPNISNNSIISLTSYHLGWRIAGTATGCDQ